MKSDYRETDNWMLRYNLDNYRRRFLKRKNINGHISHKKGTPEIISKLLNAFDRKIKGISIFNDNVKAKYFAGLQEIFTEHYISANINRKSRKEAYISYWAEQHIKHGRKQINEHVKTFKEFVKAGMANDYR